MKLEFHHVSVNVGDLDRTTKFYCEGLGFEVIDEIRASNIEGESDSFFVEGDAPDFRVRVRTLKGHGLLLNMNYMESGSRDLQPAQDSLGFSNWAFSVDNLDEAIRKLCAAGGTIKENSRYRTVFGDEVLHVAICLDPDGENIELLHREKAS